MGNGYRGRKSQGQTPKNDFPAPLPLPPNPSLVHGQESAAKKRKAKKTLNRHSDTRLDTFWCEEQRRSEKV